MRYAIWLLVVLLLIVIAIIGGLAYKLSAFGPALIKYEKEWVTALLEGGLIVVLGVVTSAVLEVLKSGMQQSKDRSKLQVSAYRALRRHYDEVKLIRRSFQLQPGRSLTAKEVTSLNRIQLDLERLRDESDLFARSSDVFRALEKMEKYLNNLANEPGTDELKYFHESKPPEKTFKVFSRAFAAARKEMRSEIAPPTLLARVRLVIARERRAEV